jgi:hypothetical protein
MISNYDYFPQWKIWWLKVQEVILPNHDFRFLVHQSIPQLRKSHTMKPLVTCQFSGTCPQSENFGESVSLLWLRDGQLWKQISRVLFGLCSAYIYSLERFLVSFSKMALNILSIL